jgi:DnaJ-class molecular chaperone
MREKPNAGPWPHGRPTIVCPACSGTGLDRVHAGVYLTARTVPDEQTRILAVRCAACDGRGRQTVEHDLHSRQPHR